MAIITSSVAEHYPQWNVFTAKATASHEALPRMVKNATAPSTSRLALSHWPRPALAGMRTQYRRMLLCPCGQAGASVT
ncbi:MAG: hypothetical protein R3226_12490 [Halomonas venusta]|nr:hypothetical protein [Halomonas venusta]